GIGNREDHVRGGGRHVGHGQGGAVGRAVGGEGVLGQRGGGAEGNAGGAGGGDGLGEETHGQIRARALHVGVGVQVEERQRGLPSGGAAEIDAEGDVAGVGGEIEADDHVAKQVVRRVVRVGVVGERHGARAFGGVDEFAGRV